MKPRYVIDLDRLAENARTARTNADRLGVRLLMALKSFPLPAAFPALVGKVEGFTASGLYEAKLAASAGLPVHVHAPAYAADEIGEIAGCCSHVVFNSFAQLARFGEDVASRGLDVGLRVNPGFSRADALAYDPCCPDSRFGVTWEELEDPANAGLLKRIDGIHVHALCEGYADDFAALVENFAGRLAGTGIAGALKWINLGGGEVVDDPAFASPRAIAAVAKLRDAVLNPKLEIFIEPSEYLVRTAGSLEAHVLDVIHREKDIAILDISASCHATDLLLFKMRPEVAYPQCSGAGGRRTILTAVSCLAGDVLGEYDFAKPLAVGDTVILGGLGSYSFAQLSWFNGIRHPDIVLRSRAEGERCVRSWDFDDYRRDCGVPDRRR